MILFPKLPLTTGPLPPPALLSSDPPPPPTVNTLTSLWQPGSPEIILTVVLVVVIMSPVSVDQMAN